MSGIGFRPHLTVGNGSLASGLTQHVSGVSSLSSCVSPLATRDDRGAFAKANVVELLEEEHARILVVAGHSRIARPCPVRLVSAEEKAAHAARDFGARRGGSSI